MNSTHKVEVVPVSLTPHPNADSLSIVKIDGYQVIVKTSDWVGRDRGAYIPPDNIVDRSRPEFSFLPKDTIRAVKLRGEISMGLLVPTDAPIGSDVTEALGVTHWNPPETEEPRGDRGPSVILDEPGGPYREKYDLESGEKYARKLLSPSDIVVIHEKLEGEHAAFCFSNGRIWCGSRNGWKYEYPRMPSELPDDPEKLRKLEAACKVRNHWWNLLTPEIHRWCYEHPDYLLLGERYGHVKGFKYDATDSPRFRAFDILGPDRKPLSDLHPLVVYCPILWAPRLYCGMWDESLRSLANGKSAIGDHIREGCVVRTPDASVVLKFKGEEYLCRK